jgi:iron(III) transport system permease protein
MSMPTPAPIPHALTVPGRRFRLASVESLLCGVLIVIVAALVLLPLGYLFYGALRSAPPRVAGASFTLDNLSQIYASPAFVEPILTTVALGMCVGIGSALVGTVLAWVITRLDIPRPALWEKLLVLPLYFSPLMLGLAFMAAGAPRVGFLNLLAHRLGASPTTFNVYSFAGVVFVLCVHYAPYAFMVLAGPMRAIGAELEEAAQVLGSARGRTMRRIIVPMLWPAIFSVVLIVFTLAAENFAVPTLLGRVSKLRTIPSEIYFWLSYEPNNPNLAAAAGTLLLIITMIGIFVYRRMTRVAGRYVTVMGKPKPAVRMRIGRWKWLVVGLLTLYLLLTTVVPIGSLLLGSFMRFLGPQLNMRLMTLRNYQAAFRSDNLEAMGNSLLLVALAATLTTVLGFLIAYTIRRTRVRGRGALDYLSMLPIAVPGMVLGIGMLWTYVRAPWGLWGSIWILLIAYVSRFIAHGVRAGESSLLQVSGEMDEAARVLGAGLTRRVTQIAMPLSKRALLSSWVLVAIFVLNEVTSTILLYSSRSTTLSVLTWQALDMAGAMQAFAFAAVQGVMTAVLVLISYRLAGKTTW